MNAARLYRLARKGIAAPEKIPGYLREQISRRKSGLLAEVYRRRNDIRWQKQLIHDLLKEDEFVLVILDACRYDYFEQEYSGYLSGNLKRCWSEANLTREWMRGTWTGNYDLTYVSTSPYTFDYTYENSNDLFRPSETFREVVDVIGNEWDPVLSTTPPESVTDAALRAFNQMDRVRSVVHYMQPHEPYIGDTRILQWDISEDKIDELLTRHRSDGDTTEIDPEDSASVDELVEADIDYHRERQLERKNYRSIDEKIKDGDLTQDQLRRGYVDNLRRVLPEVRRLVSHLDCPVVVSADHGEHLGEHLGTIPRYNHPNWTHPVLREVPWFVVDDESKGHRSLDDPELKTESTGTGDGPSDDVLSDRLEALGYRSG